MTAAQLESLIASGGRLVSLPPEVHHTDRPVLIARNDLLIDGRGATIAGNENHDGLVLCPPELLVPADCWVSEPATGRFAFRTWGVAGLSFRATPLDLGPAVTTGGYYVARGWSNVRQLQVDLWVRRNGGSWIGWHELAGMQGPDPEVPGPWRLQFSEPNGGPRFLWRDSTGAIHTHNAPMPPGNPSELRLTFRIDLDLGLAECWANGALATASFPTGLQFDGDQLGHAVVGNSSGAGHVAAGPDVSFLGFRVSIGRPPIPDSDWFETRPDTLFLLPMEPPDGPFVRWRSGAAGSGHPAYSSASGWGMALLRHQGEPRTVGVSVRDLLIALPGSASYGCGLRSFPTLDLSLHGLKCEGGACGVALPFGHTNSYPVVIDGLATQYHGLAGVWADRVILTGRDWTVKYARLNAIRMRTSAVRIEGLFYAASQNPSTEPIEDAARFDSCDQVDLVWCLPNFEGSSPRRSYYRLTPSGIFPTRARLTYCAAGRPGDATAVRLDGPATSLVGRCTLTETPPTFAGPALVKAAGWE